MFFFFFKSPKNQETKRTKVYLIDRLNVQLFSENVVTSFEESFSDSYVVATFYQSKNINL